MAFTNEKLAGVNYVGMILESSSKVVFTKKGSDIVESVKKKITDYGSRIEKSQARIAEICKRRELDIAEVLGAEDHDTINKYETKAANSIGNAQSRPIIEALQEDLNNLRGESNIVRSYKLGIEEMERISRNLNPSAEYIITYRELVGLGF